VDEVLIEVRKIKERLAEKQGFDVHRIANDLRNQQRLTNARVVKRRVG